MSSLSVDFEAGLCSDVLLHCQIQTSVIVLNVQYLHDSVLTVAKSMLPLALFNFFIIYHYDYERQRK